MKRLLFVIDHVMQGKVAVACTAVTGILLGYAILAPLPWHKFPNLAAIFFPFWLYLLIYGSIAYSGFLTGIKRPFLPVESIASIILGLTWKFTPWAAHVPFNISRMAIAYGLAGFFAYCLQRSLLTATRSNLPSPAAAPLKTSPPSSPL